MKKITVYTATYNRAYILYKGYQALCRQTCKDFEWLIVDDGSNDNTKELVNTWINENIITIRYIYQENKGVNIARNIAIDNIYTELNMCVDSDDYLTENAIEHVLDLWDKKKSDKYVGIIALDCYPSGEIVGKPFPENLAEATLFDLYEKLGISGDKKMIYKTSACIKYPCPSFSGEKYYPNRHKYYMLDKEGPCLLLHEAICVVEYLPDGITASRFARYKNNPVGMAAYREFLMNNNPVFSNIFRQSIHLVAMNMLSGRGLGLRRSKWPLITLIVTPLGVTLYLYINWKARRSS